MGAHYPVLLAPVSIVAGVNDTIGFSATFSGTPVVATVAPGTYYLRGDGASDDLLNGVKLALEASGASSVSVSLAVSADASQPATSVVISMAGFVGLSSQEDFPVRLLGFGGGQSASSGAVSSTLSSTAVWVSTQPAARWAPRRVHTAVQTLSRSGVPRTVRRAAGRTERVLSVQHVDGRRVWQEEDLSGFGGTFEAFLDSVSDGSTIEVHLAAANGYALTLDQYHKGRHVLGESLIGGTFSPSRLRGLSMWSWDMDLHQVLAPV